LHQKFLFNSLLKLEKLLNYISSDEVVCWFRISAERYFLHNMCMELDIYCCPWKN